MVVESTDNRPSIRVANDSCGVMTHRGGHRRTQQRRLPSRLEHQSKWGPFRMESAFAIPTSWPWLVLADTLLANHPRIFITPANVGAFTLRGLLINSGVGGDLYVNRTRHTERGIRERATNAVLIKLTLVDTATETVEAIDLLLTNPLCAGSKGT
jgi:hypothetical protein